MRIPFRVLRRPLSYVACATLGFSLTPSERRSSFFDASAGVARFATACAQCALVYLDYATTVTPVESRDGASSAAALAAKRACDTRAAERLLAFARAHGGVYAKLTQYISTLNHALPREWTETCAGALSAIEPQPWATVSNVFEADCGARAVDVFESIEETPIAAASIAQVHRAVLKTGERVAVKIQYAGLRARAQADIACMRFLASVYGLWHPEHNYVWLFPEFRASLHAELNFLQEARNSERVAAMFAHDSRFHIPRVHREISGERVLVMELIDGPTLRDLRDADGIRAWGAEPAFVRNALTDFFAESTFVHGFLHCDPHPANVMLQRRPNGTVQLVLIDCACCARESLRE
jgi:aarF domain-containing kinase